MKIVQVSESALSVQGHGVHTAFIETTNGLDAIDGIEVAQNSFEQADIRHIHTVGPYSLAQLLFASGKKVVSAHVIPESFIGSLVGAKYWLPIATWYLRWFYNRADMVIAVSDETADKLQAMGVGRPLRVVYNMVDTSKYYHSQKDKYQARDKYGIDRRARVVIGNGQVQPRKRVDTFINIAQKMPDVEFIWIGGMPFGRVASDQVAMQKLIDQAPDNVRFTGVVSLEEVRQYLAAGDVFVMTSEQETFGLAIVEAAASGLPVVLRDIRDYDHTFRPYATLCDESGFVTVIKDLLDNEQLYKKMQQSAGELASIYDSRTIASQLVEIYQSI